MCGIAGILFPSERSQDDALACLDRMTDRLEHRGPDARGTWADGCIALGHRRLSILDLSSAGQQPMHSECGRYVLSYNGEIYNHLELRDQLEAAGKAPAWRGHSDTETLLAAIASWGLDVTLQRASGMFAIALWDRKARQLSLARDRIGEKPLYWGWAGKSLVFGSELKALRAHPECPRDICPVALSQYLSFAYVPAPRSIHPGIFKLEPGCILEITEYPPAMPPKDPLRPGDRYGSLSLRCYWSLTEILDKAVPITDEAEALTVLEDALQQAVSRQMISDVPLGAFLSGGVDSSLIVAMMQTQSRRPVKTFTIGFENPAYDEAPHAAEAARHLGTEHTEIMVTDTETRDVIPSLPELYDEPFGDSSQIPSYLVSKAARQYVTVALSGDAGDELFGGYTRYLWGPRIWGKLGKVPKPARRALAVSVGAVPAEVWDRAGVLLGNNSVSRPAEKAQKFAQHLKHADSIDELYRGLVSTWNPPPLKNPVTVPTLLDDPLPGFLDRDAAGRMMAQDMRTYLPDDILCKVDRAAMGVSLETRVPFLDPDILSLSARLPSRMKIRDGQGKWALRQILYRHVPRHLIERPKLGFGIPVGDWLRGPLKSWAEDLLFQDGLVNAPFDAGPIRRTWEEHQSGRRNHDQKLWTLLMLQSWSDHMRHEPSPAS